MQITNKKGEKLYLFIRTSSKEFNKPFVTLKTWEDAIKMFHDFTKEQDDDSWYCKKIRIEVNEVEDSTHCKSAHSQMIKNHRGWGWDYYEEISIEPAYGF